MARIDDEDLLKTAARFAATREKQLNQIAKDKDRKQLEAEMENKRRSFLGDLQSSFLESIIEHSDLFPMRYFGIGQIAAKAVGRIHVAMQEERSEGFATGFLVAPGVLLTNQHVLRTVDWARTATLTMDAEDTVEGLPLSPRIFQLDPERLFIADSGLDFCFVGVHPAAIDGTPLKQFGYFRLFPSIGKIMRGEYVTIIQHPGGRQKHIAARNNKVSVYLYDDARDADTLVNNNFIYYATDTLRGSSGSPVLSDNWYVVALHRRGVPKIRKRKGRTVILRKNNKPAAPDDPEEVVAFDTNEGVRISRIMAKLKEVAETGNLDAPHAKAVLRQILAAAGKPTDGPVSTPTTRFAALQDKNQIAGRGPALEIVRRKIGLFSEELGYDDDFLEGFTLPLPEPTDDLRAQLAPRMDLPSKVLLPFRHFTTVMHAKRRLPVFAAVNISARGKPEGSMGNRPPWSFDPRIDDAHQPDDNIFSQMLHRGHLAAREYIFWGEDEAEIKQADVHSFTLTNVCPQIARFNGNKEWYEIERMVAKGVDAEGLDITEFVGPIFSDSDPDYDDLKRIPPEPGKGSGIKLPLRFWKIIVWVEGGILRHRALLLDQSNELSEAGPLEFDIEVPGGVEHVTVEKISELTGLKFPDSLSAPSV